MFSTHSLNHLKAFKWFITTVELNWSLQKVDNNENVVHEAQPGVCVFIYFLLVKITTDIFFLTYSTHSYNLM